jgi:predicted TIM-barrel fold metal-dependent hydrolase
MSKPSTDLASTNSRKLNWLARRRPSTSRILSLLSTALAAYVFIACLGTATLVKAQDEYFTEADFPSIDKIDIHAHVHCESTDFVSLSKRDRFFFVNMAVWSNVDPLVNVAKHRTTFLQYEADPTRTAPVVSFPLENWDDSNWQEQTIAYLRKQFERGAVGVKIWKNIGMERRDKNGQLIMVDDAQLDPVIRFIQDQGKVLLGHLGEPKNCWLPLNEMTTNNDRSYFAKNPKYHMALHPEFPSYEEQIAARDRMLAKHPQLNFVGCHLASLEWSVDEMAKFLDRFPQSTIGVAARMGQLQYQSQRNRDKVIQFLTKYQDRILYGTDTGIGPDDNAVAKYESAKARWLRDWKYFVTNDKVSVPELDDPVQGLRLERKIVEKIYRENALRVFEDSWPTLRP